MQCICEKKLLKIVDSLTKTVSSLQHQVNELKSAIQLGKVVQKPKKISKQKKNLEKKNLPPKPSDTIVSLSVAESLKESDNVISPSTQRVDEKNNMSSETGNSNRDISSQETENKYRWVTVRKGEKEKKKINKPKPTMGRRKFVVGVENSNSLKVVPKFSVLHVSKFDPIVKGDDLEKYIFKKLEIQGDNLVSAFPLIKQGVEANTLKYVNFRVKIPRDCYEKAFMPEFWPKGIVVKNFSFPKNEKRPTSLIQEK